MVRRLIVGGTGQDGAILARQSLNLGYEVAVTYRLDGSPNLWRLEQMGIQESLQYFQYAVGDAFGLAKAIKEFQPDQIFFAIGNSATVSSLEHPERAAYVNGFGTAEQLRVLRDGAPETAAVFFGSSEVFGYRKKPNVAVHETSPVKPGNPYGISKLYASQMVDFYRTSFGMPLFEAVLFPHESGFRGGEFLVRKVCRTIAEYKTQKDAHIPKKFGAIESTRDWGDAETYMAWMGDLVEKGEPDKYVFASGVSRSVLDIFRLAGAAVGLELAIGEADAGLGLYDSSTNRLVARANIRSLANEGYGPIGDTSRLSASLGGLDQPNFFETIKKIVIHDVSKVQ